MISRTVWSYQYTVGLLYKIIIILHPLRKKKCINFIKKAPKMRISKTTRIKTCQFCSPVVAWLSVVNNIILFYLSVAWSLRK